MNLPEALTKVKQYEPLLNQQFTNLKDSIVYTVRIITIVPASFRHAIGYEVYKISNPAYLETLQEKDCIISFIMKSDGYETAFYEDNIEESFGIKLKEFLI